MKVRGLFYALSAASVASLVACGGLQSIGTRGPVPENFPIKSTSSYHVLYRFVKDGVAANPNGGVTEVNGTLYGTTLSPGGGAAYSLSTAGVYKTLWSFGAAGGAEPSGGLLDVNGTLYGTTRLGGDGSGTVFSLSTTGTEHVL